ncbi:MAG: type II secretion system F family protein [Omnitrophica bacterium]|nr:type II secretion system F family protein [Candidatus Omnitrophota bacterium]
MAKQLGLKKEIKLPAFLKIKHVSLKQLSVFTRQLSTLINAGLPLVKALYTLTEQLDGYLKEVVAKITTQVEAGDKFSTCLGRYPRIFPNVFASMIKAAELGGMMDEVLKKLSTFLEKEERLRNRVRSALIYPAFVLGVASIILGLLMVFVVPTFSEMFADLGGDLPVPTRILMAISDAIRHSWYWIILGVVGLVFAYRSFAQAPKNKLLIDKVKLRLPVFGNLMQQVAVARFSRTLGTLLKSGVPILVALEAVRDTVGNEVIAQATMRVHDSIKEGENISTQMEASAAFPPLVVRMVSVGEESGELDNMLLQIANDYEEEVDVAVSGLTSLLEPALIVFMGLIVGFIVVAMFLPLFTLARLIT